MKKSDFKKLEKGDWIRSSENGLPREVFDVMRINGRTCIIGLKYFLARKNKIKKSLTYYCICDRRNMVLLSKVKKREKKKDWWLCRVLKKICLGN